MFFLFGLFMRFYYSYARDIQYEPQSVKTSLNDEVVKFELFVHT